MNSSLLNSLQQLLVSIGLEHKYWIAYSGGLDSTVLLSLCAELRKKLPLKLHAIHINHSLSPNADAWSLHCEKTCKQLLIPFTEKKIQIDLSAGDSLEEVARDRRYAVFANCIARDDVLLTAHQQDDQAETLLLQLFRGAGLKGLAAMPVLKSLGMGLHVRPLLAFTRAQLQAYADAVQLDWIDDESNRNTKLTRNFIRHDIMTLLKTRWPNIAAVLTRSASHCAQAQQLLSEFALAQCDDVKGERENTLSVRKLLQHDAAKQRLLLRTWIQHQGFAVPDTRKIAAIQKDVLLAEWDRRPCVRWHETELRRYRDDIFVLQPVPEHDVHWQCRWDFTAPLVIAGVGCLQAQQVAGDGLNSAIKSVVVRFRQGGEIANLLGRGRHTLKHLFQEWRVLPWERDRVPLLFVGDRLVAAVGYFIDPEYMAESGEIAWAINLN